MAQFQIQIAGYTAQISSLFESTRDYCSRYPSEEEAACFLSVSREDLAFEQEALLQEALEEGIRVRHFPDPFLERAAIQRKIAEFLFDRDILMVHGSTVAVDGWAYLFTAKCGTGKSTHTRLWRQVFGHRARMVNDDKPFLKITADGVTAFGSPWSDKHGLDNNIAVPLKGICVLTRGTENSICPIGAEEALPMLRSQTYRPLLPEKEAEFERLVRTLVETVPLWHMSCNKDPEAAVLSHGAMSGGGNIQPNLCHTAESEVDTEPKV